MSQDDDNNSAVRCMTLQCTVLARIATNRGRRMTYLTPYAYVIPYLLKKYDVPLQILLNESESDKKWSKDKSVLWLLWHFW